MRIQTEFMQTQLNSFAQQAKSIGEAVGFKAALGTNAVIPIRVLLAGPRTAYA